MGKEKKDEARRGTEWNTPSKLLPLPKNSKYFHSMLQKKKVKNAIWMGKDRNRLLHSGLVQGSEAFNQNSCLVLDARGGARIVRSLSLLWLSYCGCLERPFWGAWYLKDCLNVNRQWYLREISWRKTKGVTRMVQLYGLLVSPQMPPVFSLKKSSFLKKQIKYLAWTLCHGPEFQNQCQQWRVTAFSTHLVMVSSML